MRVPSPGVGGRCRFCCLCSSAKIGGSLFQSLAVFWIGGNCFFAFCRERETDRQTDRQRTLSVYYVVRSFVAVGDMMSFLQRNTTSLLEWYGKTVLLVPRPFPLMGGRYVQLQEEIPSSKRGLGNRTKPPHAAVLFMIQTAWCSYRGLESCVRCLFHICAQRNGYLRLFSPSR